MQVDLVQWEQELAERIEQLEEELETAREQRAAAVARVEALEETLFAVLHAVGQGWGGKE